MAPAFDGRAMLAQVEAEYQAGLLAFRAWDKTRFRRGHVPREDAFMAGYHAGLRAAIAAIAKATGDAS